MSKPFDAALKHLVETFPEDWVRVLGAAATGPVQAIDADVATVSASAVRVLRLGCSAPWFLLLELQASCDASLGRRSL